MISLKGLVQAYLEADDNGLRTSATRETYRVTLVTFYSRLQGSLAYTRPDTITTRQLEDFINSKTSPASRNAAKTRLRGFFKWAHQHGLIPADPSAGLDGMRIKPAAVRQHQWLSKADVTKVLHSLPTNLVGYRDNVLLRLGFSAGLRRQEMIDLTWADYDPERSILYVRGKGQKLAQVNVTGSLADSLKSWGSLYRQGTPRAADPILVAVRYETNWKTGVSSEAGMWGKKLSPSGINQIVNKASERAGVRFAPHDMRRTFAGIVHEQAGLEATSQALRHSNTGVTQKYLERRQDAAAQATKGIDLDF